PRGGRPRRSGAKRRPSAPSRSRPSATAGCTAASAAGPAPTGRPARKERFAWPLLGGGRHAHHPKAGGAAAAIEIVLGAIGRAKAPANVAPGPAAQHLRVGRRRPEGIAHRRALVIVLVVGVGAPLADV